MLRFIFIFFLIYPFLSFSQIINSSNEICYTKNNLTNADSVKYCIQPASCHLACNGKITITVYGSNQPYYFEWGSSGAPIVNDFYNDSLCAGNYSVTITDNNNNFVDFSSNIIEEPSEIGLIKNIKSPKCYGGNDGEINILTLGDYPPFIWSWNNGFSTESLDSLISGEYILTTYDNNNCFRVDTFKVNDPDEITSTIFSDTVSCIGICDGQAIITALTGVSPFDYLWGSGTNNDTVNNLCFGFNYVTIFDDSGCVKVDSVFIENPDPLIINNILVDSACFNSCDGKISFDIEGGSEPYNIEWIFNTNIIDTLNYSLDNLCQGLYTINFSDSKNCLNSELINLNEKDSFIISSTIIDDSCYNSCSGEIIVNVLNVNESNLSYSWSNGVINSNINSNLCSDTILLEITDNSLCRDSFLFIVQEPEKLRIDSFFINQNDCFGDNNGSISINITGGSGSITTTWSNSTNYISNNQNISNLESGYYNLEIIDAHDCLFDTIFEVYQPDSLYVITSEFSTSCFGLSDGSINLAIFGGVEPYYINWLNNPSDSSYIENLFSGEYIYTVIDSNNCNLTDTAIVLQPDEIIVTDSISDVICHGEQTGMININVSGGTPQYFFDWSNSASSEDVFNLSAGNYSLILSDLNGCIKIKNFIVDEPLFPITTSFDIINIECFGENNGEIDLSVSGGTSPYQFQWSNAATSEDIFDLEAGSYSVIIIDSNLCEYTAITTINQNDLISINSVSSSPICHADSNGTIQITSTTGGLPPYTYLFSNGDTNFITNVSSGLYTLVVTDSLGCENNFQFNISETDELLYNILSQKNVSCFGDNDGMIEGLASGGTQPYNFLWSNNEITENINNLFAGNYSLTIEDSNGCIITQSFLINEPNEIVISNQFIEDVACYGGETGMIDINVTGGTPQYSYNWNNSINSEDLINIAAGNYYLILTDANGCEKTKTFLIEEPLFPIVINSLIDDVTCYGGNDGNINLSVSGGLSPYTILWNNGQNLFNLNNLSSGTYNANIIDDNNCSELFEIEINEPLELSMDFIISNASCSENNDGNIYSNISGGSLPYNYLWSNGEITPDLINVSKGQYNLSVTDNNGCVISSDIIEVYFDGLGGCIEIPSAFTPNGDGIHDEWVIYGLDNFPETKVNVFNRWGQKIFSSTGYNIKWDGKSQKGADLPIATYYYIIELPNNDKIFNGTVTIKR